jgi:hypothetical protein
VEVDLEKGLPEAIKLKLDDSTHIQKLDYEKLPFKCKSCQEYGHFAKNYPSNKQPQEVDATQQEEGWQRVWKKANNEKGSDSRPGSIRSFPNPGFSHQNPPPKSLPKKSYPNPSNIPLLPNQNSFEPLGESS